MDPKLNSVGLIFSQFSMFTELYKKFSVPTMILAACTASSEVIAIGGENLSLFK